MKLYFNSSNVGVGSRADNSDPAEVLPATFVQSLHIYEALNAALVVDFANNLSLYTLVTGVLKKNGTPATIVAKRGPRMLPAIFTDLNALTAAQKTNINTDLFGGTPPKWQSDLGVNAASLFILEAVADLGNLTTAQQTTMKMKACAAYVQDNPNYLVHPTFDATINVAGDQAIP